APVLITNDYADTEDLDGVFSGWDEEGRYYDIRTWKYEGSKPQTAPDKPTSNTRGEQSGHGGHGGGLHHGEPPQEDETLQDPRCVFQIVKRHYARYTPEFVAETCGCSVEEFLWYCEELCKNSGRERTGAFAYAVGWTQHTVGVQYIRAAAIVQLLLDRGSADVLDADGVLRPADGVRERAGALPAGVLAQLLAVPEELLDRAAARLGD